jgi:hypothetical protein
LTAERRHNRIHQRRSRFLWAEPSRRRRPQTKPPRVRWDKALKPEILGVFYENFTVYRANRNRIGSLVAMVRKPFGPVSAPEPRRRVRSILNVDWA